MQSVYLNEDRSVVLELDSDCNANTPSLAPALSGLLFTKLGNDYNILTASPHVFSMAMTLLNPGERLERPRYFDMSRSV